MQCEATTSAGRPCRAPAQTGRRFCYMHDPARAQERTEARRRGGLSLQYGPGGPGERPEVSIRDVSGVLALLETAASDLLARKPSTDRARGLVYLSGVALKAVEAGDLEERVSRLEERLKPRAVS